MLLDTANISNEIVADLDIIFYTVLDVKSEAIYTGIELLRISTQLETLNQVCYGDTCCQLT